MFGFLKKKLKDAVSSFTKKADEEAEELEEEVTQEDLDRQEERKKKPKKPAKKREPKKEKPAKKKKSPAKKKEEPKVAAPVDISKEETPPEEGPEETVEEEPETAVEEKPTIEEPQKEEEVVEEEPEKEESTETEEESLEELPEQEEEKEPAPEEDTPEQDEPTEEPEKSVEEPAAEDEEKATEEEDVEEDEPEEKKGGFFSRLKDTFSKKKEEPKEEEADSEDDSSEEEEEPEDETSDKEESASDDVDEEETSENDAEKEPREESEDSDDDDAEEDSEDVEEEEPEDDETDPEEEEDEESEEEEDLDDNEDYLEEEEEEPEKKGFFAKLGEKITKKKLNDEQFEELFWDIEIAMLEGNVAVSVIEKIKEDLRSELVDKAIGRFELESVILKTIKRSIHTILSIDPVNILERIQEKDAPFVICFVGVNGAGKTTTIGKFIKYLQKHDLTCVVAAGDTFRAAALEQLQTHADNLDVKLIKHDYGSDAAAVAFDAIKYAEQKKLDAVLVDTAGRLHSNTNLMGELQKVIRVAKADFVMFVGDSLTGNDAVEQAEKYNELIGVDGITLAKADVDEKGGATISTSYVIKKPVMFLGVGQEYDDFEEFEPKKIIKKLGL